MIKYISKSNIETEEFAQKLSKRLKPGDIIAYTGTMGAGKTTFTRGLAKGLGAGDLVSSPTFALVNEYSANVPIYHFDMYRVTSWDDLYSTGFFDYLDTDSIILIEWSENIDGALPENIIKINISYGETENERIITIDGMGESLC